MKGMRWILAGALALLFAPLAAPRAEAVDLTPAQIEQLLDAIAKKRELLKLVKEGSMDALIDLNKLIPGFGGGKELTEAVAQDLAKLDKLEDAINAIKMGRIRGGFIAPELLGGMVVLELGIYLDSLAWEFNRDTIAATSNPDFTFVDKTEEAMLTLNVTSAEYWKGFYNYWTTWW